MLSMGLKRTSGLKSQKELKRGSSCLKQNRIKPKSKKQREIETEYNNNVQFEEGTVCSGCGYGGNELSRSHLIPRSRSTELISNKENVRPHCLSRGQIEGCHEKWESHRKRRQLLDYEENMQIVKRLHPKYYQELIEEERKYHG